MRNEALIHREKSFYLDIGQTLSTDEKREISAWSATDLPL
jgi:hypothetical protein